MITITNLCTLQSDQRNVLVRRINATKRYICFVYIWTKLYYHIFLNNLKMGFSNITKVCLVVVATVVLLDGIVCPFPPGDRRAVFNPLIVPWWRFTPRRAREMLHLTFAGGPLPADPEGFGPLPLCPVRFGPCRPRRRPQRPRFVYA